MKKNDLSEPQSNAEQDLILQGCGSYLEVVYAINAFELLICKGARDTLNSSLRRIEEVMALEPPADLSVNFYVSRKSVDESFDGADVWIGACLWLGKPIDARLYLALVLSRNSKGEKEKREVCFALEVYTKRKLGGICKIFGDHPRFRRSDEWEWLAVEIAQPLEDPKALSEVFSTVLHDALQWREKSNPKKDSAK